MTWYHLFIPHKDTHEKAHLISWHGLAIYILLFILLQVGFSILGYAKPGILGTTSNITREQIIELTNKERVKHNLAPLSANSELDSAARSKANNMFTENYWAHFAPSGKSPWDFITGSGYKFESAGENLAKNFTSSGDVVSAWMASSTHRENLLNPKYKDIGIAVEDGVLNGQKTTLVVQMFGKTAGLAKAPTVSVAGQTYQVPPSSYESKSTLALTQIEPVFDPFKVSRTIALGMISLMIVLLAVDLVVLKKRGVFRINSTHLAHMAILGVTAASILTGSGGSIL